jgi:glycosyltransferase involved in cell wall biosynthesis
MTVAGDAVQPAPAQAPGRPLRVALVSETYPPEVNGVARTLANLTGDLVRWGNEVLLVLPSHPAGRDGTPCQAVTRCVPSVRLPFYPEVRLALPRPGSVLNMLRQFRPDVVHLATEGPLGLAALQAAQRLGLPCVSSYHTNFPMYLRAYRCGALAEPAWKYLRWFHNRTFATLCPTAALQEALAERGFERLTVWGRGVDASLFSPLKRRESLRVEHGARPGDVVLLYVGRLAAEKNLEALLAAFGLLRAQGVPVQLWLVGDGPARRHLERRAGPGVRFTGFQHGEALAETYASADLFTFASLTETFGNVLQEAMASGLPVVALRAPGPQECVRHGATGLLVDGATPAALARACDTLVQDAETRRRLGRKAREAMLGRHWETANAVVRDLYSAVRGRGRAGVPSS